jgi:phosphoribosylformylglycinamidine synthase PurS subunit
LAGLVSEPSSSVTLEVRVELKPGILDPEAESIAKSLALLGVPEVSSVGTARLYILGFTGVSAHEAERLASRAVDRLLANPVIHRVTISPPRPS